MKSIWGKIPKALRGLIVGLLLVVISLISGAFPWAANDSGYRTHVQNVDGNEWVRFEPGWYWVGPFAKLTKYPDVMTVRYGHETGGDGDKDISFQADPFVGQFNDATQATVSVTVRWDLPDTEQEMIQIHKNYRGASRLAHSTLANYTRETMVYSLQLQESETNYSGGRSQLKDDFQDQLRHGQFLVDQTVQIKADSITRETERIYVRKKRTNVDGTYTRSPSDVQVFNIIPSFVSVDKLEYDSLVVLKLQAKIEQSTMESVSKQALITAEQEAMTAESEGRKLIAQVRAKYEADKQKSVIEAEKQKEIAMQEALQAKYVAQKIEYEKTAEATANRLLVASGLTPQQQMSRDIQIADIVSKNMASTKFPQFMILGGGEGSPMNPWDALGFDAFLRINDRLNPTKN